MGEKQKPNKLTETDRILNRHKARLLCNLEDAHCPEVFVQAVCTELNWLRSDLNEYIEKGVKRYGDFNEQEANRD